MNSLYNFKSNFKIKSENIKSRGLNEKDQIYIFHNLHYSQQTKPTLNATTPLCRMTSTHTVQPLHEDLGTTL